MGKSVAMTAKFTEEESKRIDAWAESHKMTRSGALHELVMRSFTESKTKETQDNDVVTFRFTEDLSYFWKDHEYVGFLRDDEAHIKFGGEWMIYPLKEIPADIVKE